jgi:hypothetical protein
MVDSKTTFSGTLMQWHKVHNRTTTLTNDIFSDLDEIRHCRMVDYLKDKEFHDFFNLLMLRKLMHLC